MTPIDWERHDRDLERADGCVGCGHHTEACMCPTRLPVRLRLVEADQPTSRVSIGHVRHLPLNDDDPGAGTAEVA